MILPESAWKGESMEKSKGKIAGFFGGIGGWEPAMPGADNMSSLS